MVQTCTILQGSEAECLRPERTIVVTGWARGGTSMVALVLRGLGVPMGEWLADNHEDLDFFSALKNNDLSLLTLSPLVNERNRKFPVWGFKSPLLLEHNGLPRIVSMLRNPVVVVVFRNPLAIAESQVRKAHRDLRQALLHAERLFGYLRDFLAEVATPVLAVNYEAAIARPAEFVRTLAGYLGLPADAADELAASLVSPEGGGYRMLPNETWSADFTDTPADPPDTTPLRPQPGCAVAIDGDTVRYSGNVFQGADHLIRFDPQPCTGFGGQVRLLVTYPSPAVHPDLTQGGHNLYISLGGPFSLGLSRFLSRADHGRILRISGGVPIAALALGISNDAEFGMPKDLPQLSTVADSADQFHEPNQTAGADAPG